MNKSFSVYLDLIRFTAAFAVFLHHLVAHPFTQDLIWWRFGVYGRTAVIIFFVLSGYVISHVSAVKENTLRTYFASRVSRLYSVVLIAIPLTFLLDTIGMRINPEFYGIQKVLWEPATVEGYVSSFFFVNEYQIFGLDGVAPGTNAPYWSLSFEATYYCIAGLALFLSPIVSIPIVLFILLMAGKTIAALFPIWLAGFFLYRIRMPWFEKRSVALGAFLISALLIAASGAILKYLPQNNGGLFFPWGIKPFNSNLIEDYFIAFAFCIHLAAARSLLPNIKAHLKAAKLIGWLGSLTFPLYLLHYPIICIAAAISPWGPASIMRPLFIGAITASIVIVATPLSDKLKLLIRGMLLDKRKSVRPDRSPSFG
jgi:peptidoglycan/LPS O-acetylase OafA/YrhL